MGFHTLYKLAKELIGNSAIYSAAHANLSGGNEYTQYSIRANYKKESSVFPGDFSDQKSSIYFNLISNSLNKKFRMDFSGLYLLDLNRLPTANFTQLASFLPPNAPAIYLSDGSLNWMPHSTGNSSFNNPFAALNKMYESKSVNVLAKIDLRYQLTKNVAITTNFLVTITFNKMILI